jgi:hypothetical protein
MTVALAEDKILEWWEKPQVFVREVFGVTPDAWQDDVLAAFPHHQRIAMKACKGPGKTALESWLAWNFLLTRPHPKIAATSITRENLADNLWTEMAKWQAKSELLKGTFEWQKTRIISRDHPETWWMSARSWRQGADPQQQADTLAGLHADYVLFILDESGGIPSAVMASAEAALSTGIEAHIVQAGNPIMLDGPLYAACTTERRLWFIVEITGDPDDPKRSPRVKAEWAREQIEKYGRDNPWVLVNVFGRFPPSSINTLIGPDEVSAATRRGYKEDQIAHAAKVLGVDVARFGDDSNIIFPRQGLIAFNPLQYRNINSFQMAGAIARKWGDWNADATFIDDTGGWAVGVIDCLRQLGRSPIGVPFSGEPNDRRYYNKRSEMAFECVAWIKAGGQIPDCPELAAALTKTTYTFKGDALLLEPKDLVKIKLGYSPDHMDGLMLTFAQPVLPRGFSGQPGRSQHRSDYDPYKDAR